MKRILAILLILFIATITNCYYDSEEQLYPNLSTPCQDTIVTFSGTVTQILHPCLDCHSNSAAGNGEGRGIKLENYEDVKIVIQNGQLMRAVRHESEYPMPPQGKLPDCEIEQLQKWIDNDALKN